MGNEQGSPLSGMSMCCNNAYINKNHELIAPEFAQRVKMQERLSANKKRGKMIEADDEDKENGRQNNEVGGFGGGAGSGVMQISDKIGDNEILVKHIRSISSIASRSGVLDQGRIQLLEQIVDRMP